MTHFFAVPPFVFLCLAGAIVPLCKGRTQKALILGAPFAAWTRALFVQDGACLPDGGMLSCASHDFSLIFASAFCLAAFLGGLFGLGRAQTREISAAYIYAGGALGVTFSRDLSHLFIFWETMAIASTLLIYFGGTERSSGAAKRYAYLHVLGGALLMAGIAAYAARTGNDAVAAFDASPLKEAWKTGAYADAIPYFLMLAGIGVCLAAPPFSAWLPDAYPAASPFGAVFLSAFTTKTAVFATLTLFAGFTPLIVVGMVMIFYGVVYAMLENDMRRILSYSVVNQVGFMVVGAGIGTKYALLGAAAHAFCHIIYKALLFMSAGSVLYATGESRCSRLGGLHRAMPVACIGGIVGALAISAFPLTSGFVSKSLILEAAGEQGLAWTYFLLTAASAGVFLHAGVKFPWFVFFNRDNGLRPEDASGGMKWAIVIAAAWCVVPAIPGLTPYLLYSMLPEAPEVSLYGVDHVTSQIELLVFSGLAFFLLLPWLKRTETVTLDFDWFYRKAWARAGKPVLSALYGASSLLEGAASATHELWRGGADYLRGPDHYFARNWSFSAVLFIAILLLQAYILMAMI
ncbi:MAG: proton-conducting transporter membrane subunit [Rickettsiales bacterium]